MFDVPGIQSYVNEILNHCKMPTKHSKKFVELALERKERFHKMGFDTFGRREIPFSLSPETMLNDYDWFRQLLKEMKITTNCLTVLMGKIFVLTAKGGGVPLTKLLSKEREKLWTPGFKWYEMYPDKGLIYKKDEVFLGLVGSVANMDTKAVISINPGDFLRKSIMGKYSTYSSCHNLEKTGGYSHGPINYALDRAHLLSYICSSNDPTQKILGRSIVTVSNDMEMIGMRRFYPSVETFGPSRAKAVREEIHKLIDPSAVWYKAPEHTVIHNVTEAQNGYADAIVVATYKTKEFKHQYESGRKKDVEMSKDIFCFHCGKIHQLAQKYCQNCKNKPPAGAPF